MVVGSRQMASFDDVAKRLVLYDQRVELQAGPVPVQGPGGDALCRRGALAARMPGLPRGAGDAVPPITDGRSGLRVLQVLQAAQRSLVMNGEPVPLPLEPVSLNGAQAAMRPPYYVHPSAYVDEPCTIGAGTQIWHFCHVMAERRLGALYLGQNVHVAPDVVIGNNVKLQITSRSTQGWNSKTMSSVGRRVSLRTSSTPGADRASRSVCADPGAARRRSGPMPRLCGATIGRCAFIGAGAVVRGDVPDYALMLGVPAGRKAG